MKHADHPEKARLEGLVRQIRALMTQNGKLETYFRNELEWLDSRESLWRDNAFRVGLLGVTSSGKSTLVNALLEARLLPDAVRPSSNCLVVCEWGEVTEAVVRFQDSARKPEVFRGSGISAGLATFADEKTNPRNREGVREICVRSPLFRFGRGVSLVDTPGLDAYGHDEHEALTLEVLLPTVDVVLFLTTCKANSDAKPAVKLPPRPRQASDRRAEHGRQRRRAAWRAWPGHRIPEPGAREALAPGAVRREAGWGRCGVGEPGIGPLGLARPPARVGAARVGGGRAPAARSPRADDYGRPLSPVAALAGKDRP